VALSGVKVGGHEDLEIELEVAHKLGHGDHPGGVSDRLASQVEVDELLDLLKEASASGLIMLSTNYHVRFKLMTFIRFSQPK
jgi:hypothetical protein